MNEHPLFLEDSISYTIDGVEYRDYLKYVGFRILFKVYGSGNTISIPAIIL